ncbi:MAG: DMT family transporter [Gammaproteobacteria bacterium]|nr:DMT family transporter [Gammaproteobacteria bacterium]
MARLSFLPALALILLSLCWGYSWILNKLALTDAGPFTYAAYRALLASICLLLALPLTGRSLKPDRIGELLLLGLIQTTAFVGLSMWALVQGGVGSTSILVFTMPFWTLILAWPLLGERVQGSQWLAVGLAAIGLLIILRPWDFHGLILSKLLALVSGVLWAIGSIMVKRLQRAAPRDLLSLTAWQMMLGAIPLFLISLVSSEPAVAWSGQFISVLLGTAIVSTAAGWLLWVYALKHVEAGIASMSMLAVPVIAIVSAAWHFGERPRPEELTGMSLILLALLIIGIRALRQHVELAGPMGRE